MERKRFGSIDFSLLTQPQRGIIFLLLKENKRGKEQSHRSSGTQRSGEKRR